jgi:hypothetical protein
VSDGILTVLKICLMALVYLFLMRVVAVVSSELKGSPTVVMAGAPAAADTTRPKSRRGWRVDVVQPAHGGTYEVAGELTIGRAPGCAISLPDDTFVSQVHARIFERGSDLWVEDLGSTNGTMVAGKRITEPRKMRRGDRVQIGATVLEARR